MIFASYQCLISEISHWVHLRQLFIDQNLKHLKVPLYANFQPKRRRHLLRINFWNVSGYPSPVLRRTDMGRLCNGMGQFEFLRNSQKHSNHGRTYSGRRPLLCLFWIWRQVTTMFLKQIVIRNFGVKRCLFLSCTHLNCIDPNLAKLHHLTQTASIFWACIVMQFG